MNRFQMALVLGLALAVLPAAAQLRDVPLEDRTDEASLIVEATVISSTPFWNPDRTRILTANRLQVHKVLKLSGRRLDEVADLDLLTLGGTIDDHRHDVRPALRLEPGWTGLFFLERRDSFAGLSDVWLPASGPLGFVRYDEFTGQARDPFRAYPDLQRDLFEPIRVRTGQSLSVVGEKPQAPPSNAQGGVVPTITGYNPTTVRGGVQELLTIDGSGFGSFNGSATVLFDDPDDGPGTQFAGVTSLHIVFWSDTQIQVLVPDSAGTGPFFVREPTGLTGGSPGNLTVEYALNETVQTQIYRVFQEDEDDRGGYTFKHSTTTANNGVAFDAIPNAVNRFEDALETWRCGAGWTAGVDGTTSIAATGEDGVNIVAFDNDADPLPGSVLGRASTFTTGCGDPQQWHVQGIDIRFRRDGAGVSWFFGADTAQQMFGEHDFQSVAAHELGHAVQHRHINDTNDMMFWSITNGQNNRVLTPANIAGGQDILAYSNGRVSACATGMRTFQCNAAPTARFAEAPSGACGTSLSVDFIDLSYDGPTSWNWSFGDTNSSVSQNPSHTYTSAGVYDVSLDVSNANGADAAGNFVVITNAPATACAPTFAGYNNCCSMGPENVSVNTIDHTTQTNTQGDPQFDDLSCSIFTVLEPGMSYPISVTNGGPNDEVVRIYIDWNNDGAFDASELILDSSVGAQIHNGTVNVPASPVMNAALRMRVLSDFVSRPISGPCENIEYGQVEDYSVLVRQPVAISPGRIPDNSLLADKTGPTTVAMTWNPSCGAGATDYAIYQGTIGDWTSHTQKVCSTGGNTFRTVGTGTASRYFLVVPLSASAEGSYGTNSDGVERPVGVSTCSATQDTTTCP